ncbi:uncharacterized protein LOC127711399 [Mytilus californianus]|uniref:uncharacterized protein LOC127711399 n=1 Tax=Mytilus californianus TaxID=6549 RepID=UPI0022479158|nr:uncharacterized protein LOC127711399 [Mytilus californianus]
MVRSNNLFLRVLNWVNNTCCCRRLCDRKDRDVSSSKGLALTGEIEDLQMFSLYDYPINLYKNLFHEGVAESHQKLDKLGEDRNWDELVSLVNTGNVYYCRLPIKDDSNSLASLYTPLHHAAAGKAPKHVFEDLLEKGASKCLKTTNGETAYDLAVKKSLDDDILRLLEVPENIQKNSESIATMEKSLHTVILGRAEKLIQEHGVQLPQLVFLYEKGPFHYSVPMMYGGFNVRKYNDGIKVHSFCRVVGGSEQDHVIEKNGKTTLKDTGYDCAF